ncbi:MAG TPA: hypothetical protein VF950_24650 [Planctomycetota bacterium]
MRYAWAIAAILGLAPAATAQDGGKLAWRGKNEEPRSAMADARRAGKPMLLFFTSEG